ncbi:MAG: AAA family ATPase [Clostridia bacterium]
MRIISCHIDGFGKLVNLDYEFAPTLNSICQPNGWGKTTLAVFIKAMLYDIQDVRKDSICDNEYDKYKPFADCVFGGSLIFSQNDKIYRIERTFGRTKDKKSCVVYDQKTNMTTTDYDNTQEIGVQVLGVDVNTYMRSYYLPQNIELTSSDENSSLNSLLAGQSEENYKKALDILDKKRMSYKLKKGRGGLICKLEDKISQLQLDENQARKAQNQVEVFEKQLDFTNQQIKELETQIITLKQKIALSTKQSQQNIYLEHIKTLENKLDELIEQTKSLKESLPLDILDENKISQLMDKNTELIELAQTKLNLDLQPTQTNQKTLSGKSKIAFYALIAMFIACLVGGCVAFVYDTLIGIILIALAFVCSAVSFVIFYNNKLNQNTMYSKQTNDEQTLKNRQAEIEGKIANINEYLSKYFGKICLNYSNEIIALQQKLSLLSQNCKQINELKQEIADYKTEHNLEGKQLSVQNIELLQRQLDLSIAKINALTHDLATEESQIKTYKNLADKLVEIVEQQEYLGEELKKCEEEFTLIDYTSTFLKKAKQELALEYLPKLRQNFKQLINIFTELNFDLDINLTPSFTLLGQTRKYDFLSQGYKDIVKLCSRLALCGCLDNKNNFLILDDPLANMDDDKLVEAKRLLVELSKQYQIIYIVCHSSRS